MGSDVVTSWDELPILLSVKETCRVLRRGHNQVYELIRRGELPCLRVGHRVLVQRDKLRRMIEAGGGQELAA